MSHGNPDPDHVPVVHLKNNKTIWLHASEMVCDQGKGDASRTG